MLKKLSPHKAAWLQAKGKVPEPKSDGGSKTSGTDRTPSDLSLIDFETPDRTHKTRSGVFASFKRQGEFSAMQASVPAGMLPFPVQITAGFGHDGKFQAEAEGNGKSFETSMRGTEVVVDADPTNPQSPLLVFGTGKLDYGLESKPVRKGDLIRRELKETVHSDGSRTLVQGETENAYGSGTRNEISVAPDGKTEGVHFTNGVLGEKATRLKVTTDGAKIHTQPAFLADPLGLRPEATADFQAFSDGTRS